MNNLYAFFSCNTKEELYKKVKEDDESVRSLVDFIEYSKGNIKNREQPITSPESFIETVIDERMPDKNEVIGVFVNTKHIPVHIGRMQASGDMRSYRLVLKEGLGAGAVDMFLLSDVKEGNYDTRSYFETFGLNVIDVFRYNQSTHSVRSEMEGIPYRLERFVKNEVAEGNNNYPLSNDEIINYDGYEEFTSYYSKEEVIGLNIFKDNMEIQEILKVGYQYNWQESFGVILCDSDGYVTSFSELFKGSPNSSIVDRKVFTKELLSREDTSFVAVFHNHPSGDPEPSLEDRSVTNGLKNISETLDMQLLDHFIVGKQKVYSFANEGEESISYHEGYAKNMKDQQIRSYRQKTFDFEMEM